MLAILKTKAFLKNAVEDEVLQRHVHFLTGDRTHATYMIALRKNEALPAHYHRADVEIYYILSGEGRITTAKFVDEQIQGKSIQIVEQDDTFSIDPYVVHQIENVEDAMLYILAIAPRKHADEDRYFVDLNLEL